MDKSKVYELFLDFIGGNSIEIEGIRLKPERMESDGRTIEFSIQNFNDVPYYSEIIIEDLKDVMNDFSKYTNSQYKVSKAIADPAAGESALWAIRECASRAGAIPPAQEGPYANLPLTEVMNNITEQDLQAFLRYVKAYPGNYVSRSLKISETFATWVVYGAPQP